MQSQEKRLYLLYLKAGKVYGLVFAGSKFLQRIESSLEDLPYLGPRGNGYLLLADEDVQYNVISLPSSAKIQLQRVMMHEAEGLAGQPASQIIYKWRLVGKGKDEDFYLLAVISRDLGSSLLSTFKNKGLRLQRIITPLDLLIERGRDVEKRGGGCHIFFEGKKVYVLFFQEGSFLFYRIFELALPPGKEGLAEELVLEIKRSMFYLQQKYKIPCEWMQAISSPPWLDEKLGKRIEEEVRVSLEVVPLAVSLWPEKGPLDLLAEGIKAVPSLLSLIPKEVELGRKLGKVSPPLSLFLTLMIILSLVWVWGVWSKVKEEMGILAAKRAVLESMEGLLQQRKGRLEELKRLKRDTQEVSSYLQKRSLIYLPLGSFPYLIPSDIHLESLRWISTRATGKQGRSKEKNPEIPTSQTLQLIGRVDGQGWEERYKAFWRFVEALKGAPFVQKVDFETVDLLKKGLFVLRLELKGIRAEEKR
ncbi:MAG: hypothetical protein JRI46_09370 [Deltaproteobacteria bacterium]|nr:hypothetical protein [Deltaproteobacteria bacterium]